MGQHRTKWETDGVVRIEREKENGNSRYDSVSRSLRNVKGLADLFVNGFELGVHLMVGKE